MPKTTRRANKRSGGAGKATQQQCAEDDVDRQQLRIDIYKLQEELDAQPDKYVGLHNSDRLNGLFDAHQRLCARIGRSREMVLESDLLKSLLQVIVNSAQSVGGGWNIDCFVRNYGEMLHGKELAAENGRFEGDLSTLTDDSMRKIDVRLFFLSENVFVTRTERQCRHCCTSPNCQHKNTCVFVQTKLTKPATKFEPDLSGMRDCLFGEIDLQREPAEKGERQARGPRVRFAQEKVIGKAAAAAKGREEEEEATVKRVDRMYGEIKKLSTALKPFGSGAVHFWRVVIDPQSFALSVQNLFDCLYLFKDAKVHVKFDDDGWAWLHPIDGESAGEERATSQADRDYHWMPTLSMAKWRQYIDILGL